MAWLWLSLLILAVVACVISKKNIFITVLPGLVISCVMDFFGAWEVFQIIVTVVSLAVCLIVYKVFVDGRSSFSRNSFSLDDLVGERCVVVERVDSFAGCGLVKVGNKFWSARGTLEDDTFEAGESLIVVAIEGVKLICKRV